EIKSVSASIDKPVDGQALDFAASASGNFSIYKVKWDDYTAKEYELAEGTKAIAGHKYRLDIQLKPNSGYVFPYTPNSNPGSDWQFYSGTAKLNGENCTTTKDPGPYATVLTTTGSLNSGCLGITVYYTATAPAAAPVITQNPKDQAVKEGETAKFTVAATGDDLKYQWYIQMPGASTSQKAGSTSATLTLAKVNMDYNGARVWCEVSNSVGSATSTKATLTVGDSYIFPFTDVYTSDWYYNDVKIANQMKLIDGKSATLFKPNDNMTYAEAIKLAACMNQVYNDGMVTLTPKAAADWYTPYVDYAKAKGIPWNFSNYNAPITRADYVYIFYYALPTSTYTPINSIGSGNIPDVFSYTPRAGEIYAFYRAGILTGNTKHYFLPNDNIRRSEVAAILTRMMDPSTRQHLTL
ncbi:MAG: S-layer homology domain-containing protein, partial [Firmicutes bacterium]|nr:S-layer homology domain-containing protein [Bacillota bacterium]